MKLLSPAFALLFFATVLVCAAADDLEALKTTLLNLCTANTAHAFGSCCGSNNNGQDIPTITALPSCFGSVHTADSGAIQRLFVSKDVGFFV